MDLEMRWRFVVAGERCCLVVGLLRLRGLRAEGRGVYSASDGASSSLSPSGWSNSGSISVSTCSSAVVSTPASPSTSPSASTSASASDVVEVLSLFDV